MNKVKVAIIGSGNIGTDLMYKIERSPYLQMTAMIGIEPESEGLKRARNRGYVVIDNGIQGFEEQAELAEIVFDATSAKAHHENWKILKEMGKTAIDLTPAAIGPFLCPSVNLGEHIHEKNVNLITCGGQATIPMVHAIDRVADVSYAEIVATISSRSAGPGTRMNIDEFTVTTAKGLVEVGGADKGKAIIVLNPADPPIIMRDTIYTLVKNPDAKKIIASVRQMEKTVQEYVPGYRLRFDPLVEEEKVTVMIEVEGRGDFLPPYAGNLDIMTAAATKIGEEFAKKMLNANIVSSRSEV